MLVCVLTCFNFTFNLILKQLKVESESIVESVKLLVFHLDCGLDLNVIIDGICKKPFKMSFLMWKIRNCERDEYLRISYFSFV